MKEAASSPTEAASLFSQRTIRPLRLILVVTAVPKEMTDEAFPF
jgi:hypothetical protein